tara:strand:- start:58 stop:252 length:195 start_codon:yes stop_codon:yes gene_type:complete
MHSKDDLNLNNDLDYVDETNLGLVVNASKDFASLINVSGIEAKKTENDEQFIAGEDDSFNQRVY